MIFSPYFISEIISNTVQCIEFYLKEGIETYTLTFTKNENVDTFRIVYKNLLVHQKFPIDVQAKISRNYGR